jgi:hypothetical protein
MRFLLVLISSSVFLLQSLTVGAKSPPRPQVKSFAQCCLQRKSVPVATRHTIDVLLKEAGTNNCRLADRKLISGSYTYGADRTDSAKSCQKQTSIKIIDESDGRALFPIDSYSFTDPPFKNYVNIISKYAFEKIDEIDRTGFCSIDAELTFVYRPLISEGIAPFNFKPKKSKNTRYLDSPWVKLSINKLPKLVVRVAFIWNERQFLFDQALMAGAKVSSIKPLLPLDENLSYRYGEDYGKSVIRARSEERATAQVSIEKRVPADLLWGFRKGTQGGRGGDFPDYPVIETVNLVFDKYVDITKALLNRRFTSERIEQNYSSVLTLRNIYNIDLYRVRELH